jgi:hypothetical protein
MTPAPAPEVLEAMRAAFKQRSSQMMGDPGKLDYNAIELEAFAAAAGALAAAGWRPPVAVPEGREKEMRKMVSQGIPLLYDEARDLFALLDAERAKVAEMKARLVTNPNVVRPR